MSLHRYGAAIAVGLLLVYGVARAITQEEAARRSAARIDAAQAVITYAWQVRDAALAERDRTEADRSRILMAFWQGQQRADRLQTDLVAAIAARNACDQAATLRGIIRTW